MARRKRKAAKKRKGRKLKVGQCKMIRMPGGGTRVGCMTGKGFRFKKKTAANLRKARAR